VALTRDTDKFYLRFDGRKEKAVMTEFSRKAHR
jgi:hypothetical protein